MRDKSGSRDEHRAEAQRRKGKIKKVMSNLNQNKPTFFPESIAKFPASEEPLRPSASARYGIQYH